MLSGPTEQLMPLHLRKRTIFFYDLKIVATTTAAGVARPSNAGMRAMLDAFCALAAPAKLPVVVGKSSSTITYLMDWGKHAPNGSYELLVNKANAKLSDVAFRDLNTAVLRHGNKTKMEGIESSAHIVIKPSADDQSALVLLTSGCGIAPGHISQIFRKLSKAVLKAKANRALFYFDDPSGARGPDNIPIQYKVGYQFPVQGYLGQTLDEALRTGEFVSMELVATDRHGFDQGGNLQVEERTLKVSAAIPGAVTGATLRNALRAFRTSPDADVYDRLRLNYKSRSGRPASTTLELNDLDAAFTRREIIEFDVDVNAQQLKLDVAIMGGMRPLVF